MLFIWGGFVWFNWREFMCGLMGGGLCGLTEGE